MGFFMKYSQIPVLGSKTKEHNLNELASGTSFSDRFMWSFIAKQAIEINLGWLFKRERL